MSAAPARPRVLSLYRRLFRQQAVTFAQDGFIQQNARAEIRSQFRARRALKEPQEVEEAIKAAEEAADYLRTSVIQAKRVKGDHFGQTTPTTLTRPLQRGVQHHAELRELSRSRLGNVGEYFGRGELAVRRLTSLLLCGVLRWCGDALCCGGGVLRSAVLCPRVLCLCSGEDPTRADGERPVSRIQSLKHSR